MLLNCYTNLHVRDRALGGKSRKIEEEEKVVAILKPRKIAVKSCIRLM